MTSVEIQFSQIGLPFNCSLLFFFKKYCFFFLYFNFSIAFALHLYVNKCFMVKYVNYVIHFLNKIK